MCTAVLSLQPGQPAVLLGVRDEFTDRAWAPPGRHWPQHPGLIGGKDLLAGGTWLAVAPDEARAACVLNGRGRPAEVATRRSRGVLPLLAAAGAPLDEAALADLDPFHLLTVWPDRAMLHSWDGVDLSERDLAPGLHIVVNDGLAADAAVWSATAPATGEPDGRAQELARIGHFAARFESSGTAWDSWRDLADGDELDSDDPRALIVRRRLDDGRTWGTTSVSLVELSPAGVRYAFNARPGDRDGWYRVQLAAARRPDARAQAALTSPSSWRRQAPP